MSEKIGKNNSTSFSLMEFNPLEGTRIYNKKLIIIINIGKIFSYGIYMNTLMQKMLVLIYGKIKWTSIVHVYKITEINTSKSCSYW